MADRTEPRTTPETRAELRRRYTPEPVPPCKVCGAALVPSEAYSGFDDILIWDCPEAGDLMDKTHGTDWARHQRHLMDGRVNRYKGDADIIAALADADALAGALAEREWLRTALSWLVREARGYMHIESDTSEEDLAAALTHAATVLHALAGPAPQPPKKRALTGLYAPESHTARNAGAAGESGAVGRNTEGIEG